LKIHEGIAEASAFIAGLHGEHPASDGIVLAVALAIWRAE